MVVGFLVGYSTNEAILFFSLERLIGFERSAVRFFRSSSKISGIGRVGQLSQVVQNRYVNNAC